MNIELTMRLLREGVTPDQAIKAEPQFALKTCSDIPGAIFYVGKAFKNPPDWLGFVKPYVNDLPDDFENQGVGGILFIPIPQTERTMAICFGYAHVEMSLDSFERNFGLVVTLNKVPRNALKALELAAPDSVVFNRKIQASRVSRLTDFGVDFDRDVAFYAAGRPLDQRFALSLCGSDSLKIRCVTNWSALPEKCKEIFDAYLSDAYKAEGYDWIDHVQRIRQKSQIEQLDIHLYAALNSIRQGIECELHLFLPETEGNCSVSKVHFNGLSVRGGKAQFPDLRLENYLSLLESDFSLTPDAIEEVKSKHKVKIFSEDASPKVSKIYECFVFETQLDNTYFVLFRGQWFKVDKGFSEQVEAFFLAVERVTILEKTDCRTEEDLIKFLSDRPDLVLLDKTKINPTNQSYANLEPCDFFSNSRCFIHLKDGHASSVISHLWNQGVVSAEAFLTDEKFRQTLRTTVKKTKSGFATLLPKEKEKFLTSNFSVVFGIMRHPYRNGSLGIPFFSKVSLRVAAKRICNMGYKVAICLIEKTSAPETDSEAA